MIDKSVFHRGPLHSPPPHRLASRNARQSLRKCKERGATPPCLPAAPLALGEPNEILKALDSIRFRRGFVGRSVGRGQRRRQPAVFLSGSNVTQKASGGGREDERKTNPGSGFAACRPLSLSLSFPPPPPPPRITMRPLVRSLLLHTIPTSDCTAIAPLNDFPRNPSSPPAHGQPWGSLREEWGALSRKTKPLNENELEIGKTTQDGGGREA